MQHSDSYMLGILLGRILFIVGPILVLVLTAPGFKRRSANKKCLLAFDLFLLSILLGQLSTFVSQSEVMDRAAFLFLCLIMFGLMLASVVLAIIGLVEYRRRHYRHGRKRAIATLILIGLLMILAVPAFLAARNRALLVKARLQASQTPFVSEDLNFRFSAPPPWVRVPDAAKFNPGAALMMTRANPAMFFAIVAEKPGMESTMTLDSMLALAKAHTQSAASSVNFLGQAPILVNGINGVRLDYDAGVLGKNFSYVQWIGLRNGFVYQLTAWAESGNRLQLDSEAMPLFQNLQLIDPQRQAHAAGFGAVGNYRSMANGFGLRLAGSPWTRPISNLATIAPDAEFGVQNYSGDFLEIVPLALGNHDPDLDTLTSAFLAHFATVYPGDSVLDQKDVRHGPLAGYELTLARTSTSGRELRSRAQVLKGHGFAYLLIATTTRTDGSADATLDDIIGRVDFDEAPMPPDLTLMTTRERYARAGLLNSIGIVYSQANRPEDALEYFKEARGSNKYDSTYALNVTDTFIATGRFKAALDDLRAYLGNSEPTDKLKARLAFLESKTGAVNDALSTYGALFDGGFRDDEYFTSYIDLLMETRQYDAATDQIRKYLEQEDSVSIRVLLANVYQKAGNTAQALDTLHEQQQKYPEDRQLGVALAQILVNAGRYAEALDQCARLCENGQGTSVTYYLEGRAEFGLKHFREAKAALESAQKLEPGNASLKEFLDQVSGMLGEGSNTALETPIDPVAIPSSLLATASGSNPKLAAGYGAYYEVCTTGIEYAPGKEFKTTETRVIKVLNESGVTAFSSFEIPFDPLSQEIYVNELTVKDDKGALLSTGTVSDYYVIDDVAGGEASQHKIAHVPVSGVQPGCEVTLTYTLRDIGDPDEFHFSSHTFSKPFPVVRGILFVRAPRDSFKSETLGKLTEQNIEDGVWWSIEQPAIYRWEPLQAGFDTYLPGIWLSDRAATWKSVGKDYLDSIRDRLAPDDDVRKAAAEETANLKSPADKIEALARFMQKDFTYTAIEFGRRARIPNKPSTTLQNRYGDCKDHAVLLRALLDAEGIPAQLALVNAKGELRTDMPSLDQFDHVVVYVPSVRGGTFIDCTQKDAPVDGGIPFGLGKKQAFVLDDAQPHLVAIPDYPPDSNLIAVTRNVEILNESDASVREDVKFGGATATYLRVLLRHSDPGNREAIMQQAMSVSAPALEIRDFKCDNLDDPNVPLAIQAEYVIRGQFRRVGNDLIGQLPAVWEQMLIGCTPVENRETPFMISFPANLQTKVALAVPAGYEAESIPPADIHNEFATWSTTAHDKPASVEIDCNFRELAGHFEPSQYAAYHDAMSSALGAIEPNVVLRAAAK